MFSLTFSTHHTSVNNNTHRRHVIQGWRIEPLGGGCLELLAGRSTRGWVSPIRTTWGWVPRDAASSHRALKTNHCSSQHHWEDKLPAMLYCEQCLWQIHHVAWYITWCSIAVTSTSIPCCVFCLRTMVGSRTLRDYRSPRFVVANWRFIHRNRNVVPFVQYLADLGLSYLGWDWEEGVIWRWEQGNRIHTEQSKLATTQFKTKMYPENHLK